MADMRGSNETKAGVGDDVSLGDCWGWMGAHDLTLWGQPHPLPLEEIPM